MLESLPSTPREAKALGIKHYFTGVPCKNGHITYRFAIGAACAECSRIKALERSRLPHVKKRSAELARMPHRKKRARERYYTPEVQERLKQYRSDPEYKARKNEKERLRYDPEKARAYRERNKDRLSEYFKKHYQKNRERILKNSRERNKNLTPMQRERINSYKKDWAAENRKTPNGKAISFMRKCLHRCLVAKQNRTSVHLGYKKSDLINHIESTFKKGMKWENYGEWHIDHIMPIKWFLDEGISDPKQINALSNLRAIWKKENLSKGPKRTHLI